MIQSFLIDKQQELKNTKREKSNKKKRKRRMNKSYVKSPRKEKLLKKVHYSEEKAVKTNRKQK